MRFSYIACFVLVFAFLSPAVLAELIDQETNPTGVPFEQTIAASKVKSGSGSSKAFGLPDYVEYLYGVGNYDAYLVMVDHLNNEVSSSELFPSPYGPFYGAASSGMPNYFWATTGYPLEQGTGSALFKIYPGEKTVVPVGDGYGQNPRYPENPDYVINIRELAYNDDTGILYGTDYLGLYSIDTATGIATLIGDFGNGVDGEPIDYVFSMEYDRLAQMLYITNQKMMPDGFTRDTTHIYTVDMATAVPTYVGDAGTPGLTDFYQSHLSDQILGCANLGNRIYQIDTSTGDVLFRGNIADNILGLGGEFLEVPGPQVWFQGAGGSPSVSLYSELDGAVDTDYAGTFNGQDRSCSAHAFVQEAGHPDGIGQQSDIYSRIYYNHDLSSAFFDIEVDFSSDYNGDNNAGTGGATVDITWRGTMFVLPDDTFPHGTRVLVLVDGSRIINDLVGNYILDFELKVYDPTIEEPVMLLTEDDIPDDASTPFLGAFYANVGRYNNYNDTYEAEMKMTVDIDVLPGDVNTDGQVDIYDFEQIVAGWLDGSCCYDNSWCDSGDINHDNKVDLYDFAYIAGSWLQSGGTNNQNSFNLDMGVVFRSIAVSQPEQILNDECSEAIQIVPGVEYFGTTTGATGTDESSCNYNDIYDLWYKVTPQESGIYKVNVEDAGPDVINPCVSIYDSCGGTELYCWDSWDDSRFFEADAWTEYYIRVADSNSSTGDFKLAVVYYPSPENDNCDSPTEVYMGDYIEGDTFGATNDSSSSCGYGDTADIWYKYTADETVNVAVRVEPYDETADFNISIFNYECDENLRQELACVNGVDMYGWRLTQTGFRAEQGQTYLIRIAANEGLMSQFGLYIEPGPENDLCEDAIEVYMWDSQYSTTTGATGEDITSCGENDSIDVWYKYTAEYSQLVMFQVYDDSYSGMPYTVSLFDGCGGNEIICYEGGGEECIEGACSVMALYQISANETVYVRIAFGNDSTGDFQLNVDEVYPPENDECETAELLEEWGGGSTVGASGFEVSSCGYENDFNDVWFTYIPAATGYHYVFVDSYEMPFEGTASLFDGSCGDLNEIDCIDIYGYGEMYLELQQDQVYYLRVASYYGYESDFGIAVVSDGGGVN